MPSQPSLQFVVLHHTGVDHPHFDLLFETAPGSKLFGIRLNEWPFTEQTQYETSFPHRRHYLTYEGEISGQRGRVLRVSSGSCKVEQSSDAIEVKLDTGVTLKIFK